MAPRGLSAEDKRVKMLEIFHESKDFYQLKELEKLGPKLKGIVSQTVKEVVSGLVDDGLVQQEKIGSSNFFWSFPSQKSSIMQTRLAGLQDAENSQKKQLEELIASINTEKLARPETGERSASLHQLAELKRQLVGLENELRAYGACDPVKIEEKKRGVALAKEAAVRWTDNFSVLQRHFSRVTGTDAVNIRQYLEIGEDYEDLC